MQGKLGTREARAEVRGGSRPGMSGALTQYNTTATTIPITTVIGTKQSIKITTA